MTKQIKVPLLPLPPMNERDIESMDEFEIVTHTGRISNVYWTKTYNGSGDILCFSDEDGGFKDEWIAGILPKFTVVDGQIVFEV